MSFVHQIGKRHLPRTINFIQLWDEIATAHVSKNISAYGELRQDNLYVDLLGIYSGEDNVTYMYSIDGYPRELEVSYRSTLRRECKPGIRISFISPYEKHKIDWNSSRMKARLRTWKILENEMDEVDEYNLYRNLQTLDSQDWKKDSLVYLSTAEIRRKRKMFMCRSIMLISGTRGQLFDDSVKEIINLCNIMHIKVSRIIGDIPAYLKVFSPFSNMFDQTVLEQVGSVVLPDELIARFNTYSQGLIGKEGVYWGTDIFSCFPCLKPVKRTTETAENWLITSETGGGKSYFCKGLVCQLLADDNYNGTINDVEGFEYTPLGAYLSKNDLVSFVNMAEGSGAYYDPVEIVLTGDPTLDKDMYGLCASFTLSLFKCLLGNTKDADIWADIVINDAVSLTYAKAGVDPSGMSTWRNSQGFTLFDCYSTLKSLKTSGNSQRAVSSMFTQSLYEERLGIGTKLTQNDVNRLVASNEGYQKAIDVCIAKVSRYFEPNGIFSSFFKNRIILQDIVDSKLCICSFGMAGKAPNTVDPIQMALMQLYAANISHLRSIFSKHKGKYNFKLWEEFQRWGGFPDADKTINVALTGGRKLGDINIILTNKVRDMLDDDKFGVFSNLTSIAIGAITDSQVRSDLCERLSIANMIPELDKLTAENKDLAAYVDGDTLHHNPYSKAFLIGLDRTVYTISRMTLPEELGTSDIFRTGIDLATKKGEDSDSQEV